MKVFEKPLTSEEEKQICRMLKSNEIEAVAYAKKILIERNLRLVAHVAKKYQGSGEDMEDLISIGCIGLIKAIDTFDSSKGRLATYACRCIDNELLMMFRGKKKLAKEISLYEPLGRDYEGNEICLVDIIENESEDIVDRLYKEEYLELLPIVMKKTLSVFEQQIIYMRYGLNGHKISTQSEVGKCLGISRSYVSRIEKRCLAKLYEGLIIANKKI